MNIIYRRTSFALLVVAFMHINKPFPRLAHSLSLTPSASLVTDVFFHVCVSSASGGEASSVIWRRGCVEARQRRVKNPTQLTIPARWGKVKGREEARWGGRFGLSFGALPSNVQEGRLKGGRIIGHKIVCVVVNVAASWRATHARARGPGRITSKPHRHHRIDNLTTWNKKDGCPSEFDALKCDTVGIGYCDYLGTWPKQSQYPIFVPRR